MASARRPAILLAAILVSGCPPERLPHQVDAAAGAIGARFDADGCPILELPPPAPMCASRWQVAGLETTRASLTHTDGALVVRIPPNVSPIGAPLVLAQGPVRGDFVATVRYRNLRRSGVRALFAFAIKDGNPIDGGGSSLTGLGETFSNPSFSAGVGGVESCCQPSRPGNPEPSEYYLTPGIGARASDGRAGQTALAANGSTSGTLFLARAAGVVTVAVLPDGGVGAPATSDGSDPAGPRRTCIRATAPEFGDSPLRVGLYFAPNLSLGHPAGAPVRPTEDAHFELEDFRIVAPAGGATADDFACGPL